MRDGILPAAMALLAGALALAAPAAARNLAKSGNTTAAAPDYGNDPCLTDAVDLPAWLPLWTNSTLIKAALAAGCPDQWGERAPSAAYVNATLCCSGAASPALASALASGCLECGQEHSCVYNPGSPELVPSSVADELPPGSDVLAWFWDPDEGCWHEDVGEVCNATAKGAAITAEVAEAYAYQAIMLDFALKAALNNDTKTRLAVTREAFLGRAPPGPDGSFLTVEDLQRLGKEWQGLILNAYASAEVANGLTAVVAAAPSSAIALLQADVEAVERNWTCQHATEFDMQGAACLCGEELPFLHCHALYAKDLNSRVDVALQKIQGAQESTAYIPVAAQGDTAEQYAGESLPPANTDPYSNTSTAGTRRLQRTVTAKCELPALDLVKSALSNGPGPDQWADVLSKLATKKDAEDGEGEEDLFKGECELCFDLPIPGASVALALKVCLKAGATLEALAAFGGMNPADDALRATGDTCAVDPLASLTTEDILKRLDGAKFQFEMKLCITGAATTKAAWKFLTSLLKTARAVGVEDGLCFAGAKMDFKFLERLLDYQVSLGLQETEVLKDDINEAMEPHCPKDKDGKPNCKSTAVVATLDALSVIKISDIENTPACKAATKSKRMYETVACHRQCRWDFDWPPIKQFKLGFTLGLKLFGGWAWGSGDSRPLVTFSPAPMKGCLAAPPSCTGAGWPQVGCSKTTILNYNHFFVYNKGGLGACSLTSADQAYAIVRDVNSVEECCQHCDRDPQCTAFNYCMNPEGCFVTSFKGVDGSHCLMYKAKGALAWAGNLCGAHDGWVAGFNRAKVEPGSLHNLPPYALVRYNDFQNSGRCTEPYWGEVLDIAFKQPSPEACGATCAKTAGCLAWNYCAAGGYCGISMLEDMGPIHQACYLYATNFTAWRSMLQSHICGQSSDGWSTGHVETGLDAATYPSRPPLASECPGVLPFNDSRCSAPAALTGDPAGCCVCRKTSRITPVYAWDPDIPVCNWEDWVLPPGAEVAYTGRKRRGEAGRGNCPPVRFAQIVVEMAGKPTVGWAREDHLTFCNPQRACGSAVELGADCEGAPCCTVAAEGGDPMATCAKGRCVVLEMRVTVAIKTATDPFAGTDALVDISFEGLSNTSSRLTSGPMSLDTAADDFRPGSVSTFNVTADLMTNITKCTIHFQPHGEWPGWLPEWIKVRFNSTSTHFTRQPDNTGAIPNDGWLYDEGDYVFVPTVPNGTAASL